MNPAQNGTTSRLNRSAVARPGDELAPGTRGWLVAIALAAAVPRVIVARIQAIEYDGWWHIFVSRQNRLPELWAEVQRNAHPPLFYLLLKGSAVLGRGRIAYASISILSGVAAVYLLGRIAGKCGSRSAAILASCAMAFSCSAVILSTEARSYMLTTAFLLASFLGYLGLLADDSPVRSKDLALFFGGASLAMLSHNFSIFYLAAALLAAAGFFLSSDGAQRASLIQRGRTRAVALALGAGLLALLGFAADVVLWREWRKPMNYLARFYFDPNGRRSALAFAAKGLGEEAALFAPFGFAGGALAIVMLVAAVLLLADGVRSRRRRDPGPAGGFLAPATFAALTFLLVAASLLGRYPLGGELRHQSIVLPFAILTVVAGVDRGVQAFHGTAPKIAAWLSAFALVGANAAYQTAHFSYQAVGPREATAAFLEAGPPVPRDLYADQFSFIPLFAAYSDCGWRALGPVPGSEGALRYGVECPTGNFDVYRDSARWNLHLEEPQARARLDNLLDATTLRCLTCFHIDQKGAARGARAETEASVRLLDARNIREKAPFRIFEVCRQGKP